MNDDVWIHGAASRIARGNLPLFIFSQVVLYFVNSLGLGIVAILLAVYVPPWE